MLRKVAVALLALVAAIVVVALAIRSRPAIVPARSSTSAARVHPSGSSLDAPETAVDPSVRSVIVGTGGEPSSTQVSIEQDVALAAETFPGPKVVLFGGGQGRESVIELDGARARSLRSRIAALFGAPVDPDATYRPTRLAADGPATRSQVLDVLARSLAAGDAPLLVYWAGHGEQGQEPWDNVAALWGGPGITPGDLAEVLEAREVRRSAQLVMTTCFAGGFAELVFAGADASEGPSTKLHCGLFAAPWDDEASGCDPDPDRARQESFGLHFLNALRGLDRDGRPLPRDEIDLDRDGAVSPLEAHARARVASLGIEVPTTSSERYLRAVAEAPAGGALRSPNATNSEGASRATQLLPEEEWVAARLGDELGARTLAEAEDRLESIDTADEEIAARLTEAEDAADDAYLRLRIALLERWPALDDPWNPRFEEDLSRDGRAIAEALERSPAARAYAESEARVDELAREADALRLRRARAERLARAYENLELAAELVTRPSPERDRYEALLACERGSPFPLH